MITFKSLDKEELEKVLKEEKLQKESFFSTSRQSGENTGACDSDGEPLFVGDRVTRPRIKDTNFEEVVKEDGEYWVSDGSSRQPLENALKFDVIRKLKS